MRIIGESPILGTNCCMPLAVNTATVDLVTSESYDAEVRKKKEWVVHGEHSLQGL